MARTTTETTSCDVCGKARKVENVTVVYKGVTYVLDVCKDDAAPVEALVSHGSSGPRRRTPSERARTPAHAVIPID